MKFFAIRFSFCLVIFLLNCCFSSVLRAQLQEVGSIKGFDIENAQQLKNAVFISKGDSNYLTNDFQNYQLMPGKYSFLGLFTIGDNSYMVTRERLKKNPKYILRIKEDLGLDTILEFEGEGYLNFELINTNARQAFFSLEKQVYRYNNEQQSLQKIYPGQASNKYLEHRETVISNNQLYLTDTNLFVLTATDSVFKKATLDYHTKYNQFRLYPRLKVPWGVLCVFKDKASGQRFSALTNGDTMQHIKPVPQWPDTSFVDNFFSLDFYEHGFKDTTRYPYARALVSKREVNRQRTNQYRWCFYDTLSHSLVYSQKANNTHYYWYQDERLFKIGAKNLAFSFMENYGVELTEVTAQGSQLVRDIFPGMASGISTQYVHEASLETKDQLFFTATHPYHGRSLFRTNGTSAGTGIIAAPGLLSSWGQLKMFSIDDDLYVYKTAETAVIYRIQKDASFIAEKHTQPTNKQWNQSIYASLYGLTGNSGYSGTPSKMDYQDGLILANTTSNSSDYMHFPEAQVALPYFDNTHYATSAYGLWDTSGALLSPGFVRSRGRYVHVILGKDATVHLSFLHNNESTTNFETLNIKGTYNFIRTYHFNGNLRWSLRFMANAEVYDLATDKKGNLYVTGLYEDGSFEIGNVSLSSANSAQYFIAMIDTLGNVAWAQNISMQNVEKASHEVEMHIDELRANVYVLNNERYCDSQSFTRVTKINRATGAIVWKKTVEASECSKFYGIATSPIGDVWIAGVFSGDFVNNNRVIASAQGNARYPQSGLLVCLDYETGSYKRSVVRHRGVFADITATNNALFTVWDSKERVIEGDSLNPYGFRAISIEKRDFDGQSYGEYISPVLHSLWNRSIFNLEIINKEDDWLLYSADLEGRMKSDTLYIASRSQENSHGSCLIMRRPGSFLRKVNLAPTNTFDSNNPFSIYPNPSLFPEVFVRAAGSEKPFTRYQLSGLDGRVVASGSLKEESFPQYLSFPNHLRGMFILNLSGNGKPQSFKLMLE